MFTGSTATGRTVAKRAAERLIPSSTELGGKNAMLVLADASLARAVEGAERAMFSNSGQLCISIERLLVHETIASEFTRRRLATRLRAGTVNVNEGYAARWGSIDAPMGGMKDSGLGCRHGATGILKYTEPQTVSVQRVMPIAPPPLVGQRLWARLMILGLRALSRIPGVR
jgi:acyl-CoA reductase-like NAD-dependent aldehyde dehydrogenase